MSDCYGMEEQFIPPALVDDEVADTDEAAVELVLHLDERPEDPIGVVRVGDRGGVVALAGRGLGIGDTREFTQSMLDALNARLEEPVDELAGQVWAYVLPDVEVGQAGEGVRILRRLLGLQAMPGAKYDEKVVERLDAAGLDTMEVGFESWWTLLGGEA